MLMNVAAPALPAAAPARFRPASLNLLRRFVRFLIRGSERRCQLRALAALDDHLLRDIGLSREQVERASSRSFWGE
jgi:uncharacterized protein YjiS (DUF1127 family)